MVKDRHISAKYLVWGCDPRKASRILITASEYLKYILLHTSTLKSHSNCSHSKQVYVAETSNLDFVLNIFTINLIYLGLWDQLTNLNILYELHND